ncbi:MAG: 3-isopropylmalate dehydratase [Candidatus Omnitrophota bacterium]
MKIAGLSLKMSDNINTDLIISGRYKFSITDMKELSRHIFEDIDPGFASKVVPGKTILVAGNNFGMGSSREQAPLVIKESGIVAVVAKSFARIFYRNSINIGLPLIELENTGQIKENDELEVDLDKNILKDLTKNITLKIKPLPPIMQRLLSDGGLVTHFKKHNDIKL